VTASVQETEIDPGGGGRRRGHEGIARDQIERADPFAVTGGDDLLFGARDGAESAPSVAGRAPCRDHPRGEYDDEHLPDSVHPPLKTLTAESVAVLDLGRPVVVCCWDGL
jgi:hypothetical protein